MSRKPLRAMLTPPLLPTMLALPEQVQGPRVDHADQNEQLNHIPTSSRELQIVTASAADFSLPDGWVVEERPRRSKPTHVDRFYYEPHTRRQFRSLLSVRRYLAGEEEDYVISKRMISKNENTNLIESGAGQQFSSVRAAENFLSGENVYARTAKLQKLGKQSAVKSGGGKKKVRGLRSGRKRVYKRPSVAEEGIITPMPLPHSIQSAHYVKPDSQKKTKSERPMRASVHNLTSPPPAKVTWILSSAGGFWNPILDDSFVSESDKLKWSEAFVVSLKAAS